MGDPSSAPEPPGKGGRHPVERPSGVEDLDSAELLAKLQSITDAALSHLTLEELLDELLVRVVDALEVDTAAILLLDDTRECLVARAAKGLEEEVERGVTIPLGVGFAGRIAAQMRPIFIPDIDKAEIANPILRERGLRSLLGVPLVVEGTCIGVLHVGSLTPRTFRRDEASLLQLAADRVAIGIAHARLYEREHRIAETFQHELMPAALPALPGVELAGRYRPAARAADVGGDWYDAITLPDGTLGIAVGDVLGHGVGAAVVMGELRSALRAYALEGRRPAELASLLNRVLRTREAAATATLVYLVYDPDARSLAFASAGHVPPLAVGADGDARFLEAASGPPLGVRRTVRYAEQTVELAPGSSIVLVTDGLVERPDEGLEKGLDRLVEAVLASGGDDADAICDAVVRRLLPRGAARDDAAIVVLRVAPSSDRIALRMDAEPEAVPAARRIVSRWLREAGASEAEIFDVTVACAEACANAIEHSYGPVRAEIELGCALDADGVTIRVSDFGSWRPPRGTHRGRGLQVMRAMMDAVDVRSSERGTTVVLRRRVGEAELVT
jgi:serine phosphatase RsbU (regulator of sigma subunit)/anti-sigma regulatory factor (Ser/Thr protein kinase)